MSRSHFKNKGDVWINHDRDREKFVKDYMKANPLADRSRGVLEYEVQNNHWHSGRSIVEVRVTENRLIEGDYVFTKGSRSSKALQKWQCRCLPLGCKVTRYSTLDAQGLTYAICDENEHNLHTQYDNSCYNAATGRLQAIERLLAAVEQLESNGFDLSVLFRGQYDTSNFNSDDDLNAYETFSEFQQQNREFETELGTNCNGKHRLYVRFHYTVNEQSSLREKVTGIRYVGESSASDKDRIQCDLQAFDRVPTLLKACGSSDSHKILITSADLITNGSKKRAQFAESMIIHAFCRTQTCQLSNLSLGFGFKNCLNNDLDKIAKLTAFILLRGLVHCTLRDSDFTPRVLGTKGTEIDCHRLANIRREVGLDLEVESTLDEIRELAKDKHNPDSYKKARFLFERLFISEDRESEIEIQNANEASSSKLDITGSSTKSPLHKKPKVEGSEATELAVVFERITKKKLDSPKR
ncbi:hypothetical protein M3Y95_00596100 [Aphelenchoides besseyi]|nr:hypothetical protein M3Y95_00596100 [Aphelenchoides besseyi]